MWAICWRRWIKYKRWSLNCSERSTGFSDRQNILILKIASISNILTGSLWEFIFDSCMFFPEGIAILIGDELIWFSDDWNLPIKKLFLLSWRVIFLEGAPQDRIHIDFMFCSYEAVYSFLFLFVFHETSLVLLNVVESYGAGIASGEGPSFFAFSFSGSFLWTVRLPIVLFLPIFPVLYQLALLIHFLVKFRQGLGIALTVKFNFSLSADSG